jgi:hypothetical protein
VAHLSVLFGTSRLREIPLDSRFSGANDYISGPEAIPAGRKAVAEAVLLVGFREVAPAAMHAGREIEVQHPLAEALEFRLVPNRNEVF